MSHAVIRERASLAQPNQAVRGIASLADQVTPSLLRAFVATARSGSVTAAAAELHLTQPAVSRQLSKLERAFGAELFERSHGRLSLTRYGTEALPRAEAILLAVADFTVTARVPRQDPRR